ncbi:serine hydrolase domain-containing protein [Nocardioides daejeonensis]|uniref:serine hydrolase domain-containing protein n=1 Tax=Nocardioides daejeonensis TaxID=1046556 RepID=UPI000D74C2A0|nr:serine hydrolase [Nocardioides daejeonensis]
MKYLSRTRTVLAATLLTGTAALAVVQPLSGGANGAAPSIAAERAAAPQKTCRMTRTGEYPRARADEVGLDPALVAKAARYWTSTGSETVKIFKNGCLIQEGGLDKVFDRIPRLNWSQTKTVTALVAGVAVSQGLISVDEPIGKYLPPGLGDAVHRSVTIREVLNMTTGYRMNWVRGLNLVGDMSRVRGIMAAEQVHKPGTYYEYDQDTPSIVTYVVQRAIWKKLDPKLDFQEWAQREFFNKLGIPKSAYFWQRDRSGNTLGYSQLFLRPLEFGRFGELMLRNGVYQGVRIIDSRYMRELRTGATSRKGASVNCGYGYMTWLNSCRPGQKQVNLSLFARREISPTRPWIASAPRDMYYSWGLHGQHVFVIPSLDMVVTRSGEVPPDAIEGLLHVDPDAALAGRHKGGYFKFFRILMNSVRTMPAGVDIAQPTGAYKWTPSLDFDPDLFIYPIDAPLGSYLGIGKEAPIGCTLLACKGEPNDGLKWVLDVPRVAPGILGLDRRPNG